MTEKHDSTTFQSGEGKLTLAGVVTSVVALAADNAQALNLDSGERKIVLLGAIAQVVVLTIARTVLKVLRRA